MTPVARANLIVDGKLDHAAITAELRRYITKDQLRAAIREVVNATLRVRSPEIWGEGTTACASDSKKFGVLAGMTNGDMKTARFSHIGRSGETVDYWDGEGS